MEVHNSLESITVDHVLTYFASPHPVCGLHICPSPINPSARCDKGARSPLAPTVPCSGTHGKQLAGKFNIENGYVA